MIRFHLLLFCSLLCVSHIASAQTNILPPAGNSRFVLSPEVLFENEHSYYVFRAFVNDRSNTPSHISPRQMFIEQISRQTNALTRRITLFGDSVQTDSLFTPLSMRFRAAANGRFYITYQKIFGLDSALLPGHHRVSEVCYQQLDTALNVIVPETILRRDSNAGRFVFAQPFGIEYAQGTLTVGYFFQDTLLLYNFPPHYMTLSTSGTIVTDTSLTPAISLAQETDILPDGQILFCGTGQCAIVNTVTGSLDTFSFPYSINAFGLTDSYFPYGLNIVALPSGSLIGGRGLQHSHNVGQGDYFTGLAKMRKATHYAMDTVVAFNAVDPADIGHATAPGYYNIAYNSFDNRVYFANTTHSLEHAGCQGSYNYLQVVSADTNLRHSWRKFIKSPIGYCMPAVGITSCAGRSGVLVSGVQYLTANPGDTTQYTSYVYRIDSSSNLGVGDPTAPITIRNRIAAYPNPATDNLTIDDILGRLASATLTNMQGQLIYQKDIGGNKAVIPVKDYLPGLYLLRVKTTDGELLSEKISITN